MVNRTPLGDAFAFARVENGLTRAGAYCLEYEMAPAVPGCAPLSLAVQLAVSPGPAAGFEIQARLRPGGLRTYIPLHATVVHCPAGRVAWARCRV